MTTLFDFTKETIKANTTLYAKWEKIDISFAMRAVASSLELEVKTVLSLADMGAVIRLATEGVPTSTEAQASKGYVSLSIDADSTRKFSISQHYATNFDDGFTLDDVLTPNTEYKLYLYIPSNIDLGQTVIKGGEIKENRIEISFTTASLPPAGDAIWSEKYTAREYTASLNEYHFMENQKAVVVSYFKLPFSSLLEELSVKDPNDSSTYNTIGTYARSSATAAKNYHYNSGLITGYASGYGYFIGAEELNTIKIRMRCAYTDNSGVSTFFYTPISRY